MVEIGDNRIDLGVGEGILIKGRHLLRRPVAHRRGIADQGAQSSIGKVHRCRHGPQQVRPDRRLAGTSEAMARQAIGDESHLSPSCWRVLRNRCIDSDGWPTLHRRGYRGQSGQRKNPLLG